MKTDMITRIAAYFMCFFLLAPDLIASAHAISNGIPHYQNFTSGKYISRYSGLIQPLLTEKQEQLTDSNKTPSLIPGSKKIDVPEPRALIGQSYLDPMNNPRDDFFTFQLDTNSIKNYSHVVISYRVKGVSTGKGLVKAVNENPAYGDASMLSPSNEWSAVEDIIPIESFSLGTNFVRFSLPKQSMLQAQVEGFSVQLTNNRKPNIEYLDEKTCLDPAQFTFISEGQNEVELFSLNDVQVPSIPTDIINVTKGAYAYRLRTDASLRGGLIGVGIDLDRIPAGKTPKDISTFYFSFQQRGWVPVSVDSVHIDNEKGIAINFVPLQPGTQYFNGIISTPNMPESSASINTSLGHLSAPNPATGITSISPPSLSRTGDASTSFPISIPAGRNGMQPGIAITYNSSSGTGWLGVGWNITIPKITVDTRWGVPEFDPEYQTEIYSLSGEVLNQAGQGRPNRIDLNEPASSTPARETGDVLFFESVRTGWREIKRIGEGPDDYTWEVTNPDQTVYYYGLRDDEGIIENSTVLRDPSTGNIAEWNLSKVVDKWGNAIHYHYDDSPVSGAGIPNLLINAQQRVLNRITYTGYDDGTSSILGNYAIYFNSSTARVDATTHMRYGFKVANAAKLNNIVVQYGATDSPTSGGTGSTEIRNYQLGYRAVDENTYYKTQLSSISERKGGNTFYTYSFDYYDPSFSFSPTGVDINGSSTYNELGRTETEGYSAGGAAGVGFGVAPKRNFVGAEYNHSWSDQWTEYTMLDVTGDGVSDAIHSTAGNVQYQRGTIDENGHFKLSGVWESFAGSAPSYRLHTESVGDQYSIAGGFGISDALSFTAGVAYNNSVTHTRNYFADLNSDGIKDWVANGVVSFGSLDLSTGEIRYEDDSRNTPNPIVNLVDITMPEEDGLQTQSFETVRSWRAPFDGFIDITSTATLNSASDDYVYLQIDHDLGASSTTLTTTSILSAGIPTNVNLTNVEVAQGDLIFFRVNGEDNPLNDFVQWDPEIAYTSGSIKDANQIDYGVNTPSEEFTLFGLDYHHFLAGENVDISWASVPYNTLTDAVVLEVVATLDDGSTTSTEKAYFNVPANIAGSAPSSTSTGTTFSTTSSWVEDLIDGTSYTVPAGNTLDVKFVITSRTNVSWSEIDWRPSIVVTGNGQTSTTYPVVEKQFYGSPLAVEPPISFSSMLSTLLHVVPNVDNQIFTSLPLNQGSFEADFTVKTRGAYLLSYHLVIDPNQQTITVSSNDNLFEPVDLSTFVNNCGNGTLIDQIDVNNDELYFEFTSDDKVISEDLLVYGSADCYLAELQGEECIVYQDRFNHKTSNYLKLPYDNLFSNVLGWGVFGWAGNPAPLEEESLQPMPTNDPQFEQDYNNADDGTLQDFVDFTEANDIGPFSVTHLFRSYVPERGETVTNTYYSSVGTVGSAVLDRWHMVYNEFGSVFRDVTSNGVNGVDPSYSPPTPNYARINNYSRTAVVNRSVAHNASMYGSGKFKIEAGGVNGSATVGGSTTLPFHLIHGIGAFQREAMFDLNGDGYPDAVASNDQKEIRWSRTNALGGYESSSLVLLDNNAYISRNQFTSSGPRIGLGYAGADQSIQYSAGGSGSRSYSSSSMLNGLLDFNGDGLPDFYISPETNEFGSSGYSRIRLGNGNGLESPITLSDEEDSYTHSTGDAYATGGSLGVGQGFGSAEETEQNMFDFSVSSNYSWSNNYPERMFIDMNKDGLSDLVYKSGSEWKVKFNTGSGFSSAQAYAQSDVDIRQETQNLVAAVRVGFSIPLPFSVVSSVNVGANGSHHNGGSNVHTSMRDMNGDKLPDIVKYNGTHVEVFYNLDGKAGLLKSISTPLGGEITMDYELKGNRYGMYPVEVSNHQFDPSGPEPDIFWDMGYSKWVLSSVSIDDGFNPSNVNDGADVYTTYFEYDGGMHSRRERKFIGFTRVASYSDFKYGQDSQNLSSMNIPEDASLSINSDTRLQNWRVVDYVKVASTLYQDRVYYEYRASLVEASYNILRTSTLTDPDWIDSWITLSVTKNQYRDFTWVQIDSDAGKIDPNTPTPSTISEIECFFPKLTEREQYSFLDESRYFNAIKTTFDYNEYGNVTRIEVFGQDEVSLASFGDSPFSYEDSEGITHIYQWYTYSPIYVADIIVLNDYYSPSLAADRVGVISRSRLFTETTSLANLKRVTRYALRTDGVELETVTKYLDANETDGFSTTYTFNSFGNIIQLTPEQKADGDALQVDITYDAIENQYPRTVVKTLTDVGGSHSRTETRISNYDVETGLLRKTIDVNGLPTEYYYDQFQRPIKIFGPRELEQGPFTMEFEYFEPSSLSSSLSEVNLPWSIATQYTGNSASETELGSWRTADYYYDINPDITDVDELYAEGRGEPTIGGGEPLPEPSVGDPDYVRSSKVIDGIGRIVQSMQEVSDNNGVINKKAVLFSGRVQYDIWGQPMIGYRFGNVNSSSYSDIQELKTFHDDVQDNWVNVQSFSYIDAYNRISETWRRNATDVNKTSSTPFTRTLASREWTEDTETGLTVMKSTITTEGDPTSMVQSMTDSRGRTYKVQEIDVNGGASVVYTTRYDKDLLHQTLSVTDPLELTTSYSYDLFGRLESTSHPDKGTMTTVYDNIGNLDQLILQDAENASGTVTMDLEYAYNRMVQKTYPTSSDINDVSIEYGSVGDGLNGAGRPVVITQGHTDSEVLIDQFAYDDLGNRTRETRQIAVPFAGEYTFKTDYTFDSWGRANHMRYPDGEQLTYTYAPGGELESMQSDAGFQAENAGDFISQILYNGFGTKATISYGNGVERTFTFDEETRALEASTLTTSDNNADFNVFPMLAKTFEYNASGNVSRIENTAGAIGASYNNLGGYYDHNYTYDAFNRLVSADGGWNENDDGTSYTLSMTYDEAGRILTKDQSFSGNYSAASVNLSYDYSEFELNHFPSGVSDVANNYQYDLDFDLRGNMVRKERTFGEQIKVSEYLWDEADRMIAASEENGNVVQHNVYDYRGTRIMRGIATNEGVWQDNQGEQDWSLSPYTIYAAPHYVFDMYQDDVDITKHYYGDYRRVASRTQVEQRYYEAIGHEPGEGPFFNQFDPDYTGSEFPNPVAAPLNNIVLSQWDYISTEFGNENLRTNEISAIGLAEYTGSYFFYHEDCLNGEYPSGSFQDEYCQCRNNRDEAMANGIPCLEEFPSIFWYHGDLGGSTEFVTDLAGMPYEHYFYAPFGEVVVSQHINNDGYSNPYKFASTEHDAVTGLVLMGHRYYDPTFSIWVSADPLYAVEDWLSPYTYVRNNPVMMMDPLGLTSQDKETGPGGGDPKEGFKLINGVWVRHMEIGEIVIDCNCPQEDPEKRGFFGDMLSDDSYWITGFGAGIGDGFIETIEAAAGAVETGMAFNPFSEYFYTPDAQETRDEMFELVDAISELIDNEELRSQVIQSLKDELGDWWDEMSFQGTAAEAGYQQGKLVFDILLSLIGVSEVKTLLKTGKLSSTAIRKIAGARNVRKFWTKKVTFRDIVVHQRDDLIDPDLVVGDMTNLQRMQSGLAPIGPDGKPLNLHHMLQTESGSLAEMTETFHRENRAIIHINPNSMGSGINRSQFDTFRRNYWKNRANDFQ